jgi:hypothetical protein
VGQSNDPGVDVLPFHGSELIKSSGEVSMSVPLVVHEFIHEIVVTVLIGIAGSVAMWPIKRLRSTYVETMGKLEIIHQELTQQRTNHLSHIEASNEKQVEILSRVASTLDSMHLDQRELLGRIK